MSKRPLSLDGRILVALRAVAGAPPADTVDWWSLRRRIGEDAAGLLSTEAPSRVLAGLLWWRRMVPVSIAACVVAAAIAAGPISTPIGASASTGTADTTAAVWIGAAASGGALSERDVDPVVGASTTDGWFAAAIEPSLK